MKVSPHLFNHLTTGAGAFTGGPQIVAGVTALLAGDVGMGAYQVVSGLVTFVAFYFMGK